MTPVSPRGASFAPLPPPATPPPWLFRSLISKFALLLLVFLAVPIILYIQFQEADGDKRVLLLESVREQGRLLAANLRPTLERTDPSPLLTLPEEVKQLATDHTGVKVMFRPDGATGAENFFLVAVEPAVPPAALQEERNRLVERGVLDNLDGTCRGDVPIALRYPHGQGEELLTSITPITTAAGCWVVVTAHSSGAFLGTSIGQPYWKTLEIKSAALIYLVMAAMTTAVFISIWRSLTRFRRLARQIRTGATPVASFEAQNQVPELSVVAGEFDRMTRALQDSADGIMRAAEDNAHAFKTPIAIIRQSLEPLSRIVPEDSARGRRALQILETSVDRLDHLVACARHLDEASAELIDPPRHDVNLSRLVERMLQAYSVSLTSRGVHMVAKLEPGVVVRGSEELLETVIENVVDNALGVSSRGSEIGIQLKTTAGRAEIAVRDQGPGVPTTYLERIFERYVSIRPTTLENEGPGSEVAEPSGPHLGIGLWIVRRNLTAIGGDVRAENRSRQGLAIFMRLPLAA